MRIIKVHPDGRREPVGTYEDITLAAGRNLVHAAAILLAGPTGAVGTTIVPRGDLRVYVATAYDAAGATIATLEEEWPQPPDATPAVEFYDRVQGLDGDGLVVTDNDRLAEAVGRLFDVPPEAVYPEYGGADEPDEEDDEDDDEPEVAPPGVTADRDMPR